MNILLTYRGHELWRQERKEGERGQQDQVQDLSHQSAQDQVSGESLEEEQAAVNADGDLK